MMSTLLSPHHTIHHHRMPRVRVARRSPPSPPHPTSHIPHPTSTPLCLSLVSHELVVYLEYVSTCSATVPFTPTSHIPHPTSHIPHPHPPRALLPLALVWVMSCTAVLALASARVCAYPPYPSSPVLTSRCRLLCLVGSAFISVRRPGPRGRGACTRSAPRPGALLKRAPPRESPARCGPWAPRRLGGSGVVVSGFKF